MFNKAAQRYDLVSGNFGIVWSGKLFQGPVKEIEVAIKKIKGIFVLVALGVPFHVFC